MTDTNYGTAGVSVISYRRGRHWANGNRAEQHPGRLSDCAVCMTLPEPTTGEADAD